MPNDALTTEVKEFAHHLGADLVGVAPVERFKDAPPGHKPEELLPGARSVISMAIRFLDSSFMSPNPRVYVLRYWQLRSRFQDAGYEMCRFLEDRGHYAINFPSTAPQDSGPGPEGKMLFGDFSHRHAAWLAGLGEMGLNQLLITPQFGPRVWLMSVITTAELSPDPTFSEKLCPREKCNLCVQKCPTGALSQQRINRRECVRGYGIYGLTGFLRHLRNILDEKDPEKQRELIFGPKTWTFWMVLQYGSGPSMCNACIATCPVGWKAPRPPIIS